MRQRRVSAARDDEKLPDYLREYGEIWTAKPKVLVSRGVTMHRYTVRLP
ncbi:hypothetical protein [Micromonospora sp. NPDC005174]